MGFAVRMLVLAVAFACASVPLAADARRLWEHEWQEVRTEHFVIASVAPLQRSVALAVELENLRSVARVLIGQVATEAFEERIPTRIYLLPDGWRMAGAVEPGDAGFVMMEMRANYAGMRPDTSSELLKHRYIRFLIRNHAVDSYPPWFVEGLAELLETSAVRDGTMEYGRSTRGVLLPLGLPPWMSFSTLVTIRAPGSLTVSARAKYRSQAWLLMHYLAGRDGHSFSIESAELLRRSEAGESAVSALRAAFGVDADELILPLRAYVEQAPYYRAAMPYPLPAVEPAVRGLAADEVAAELGRLALVRGGYRQSQEFFVAALEANPLNANALAGMGAIHARAERFEEAERNFAAAVAAEPANGYHELDWGEYLLVRASSETDAAKRHDLLTEARRHFARSHDVDPNSAETLAQIGLSYLGEDAAKAVTSLEAAYRLLPSQPALARHLAKAYIDAGRPQSARQVLNYLLASVDAGNVDELVELLDTLPQS